MLWNGICYGNLLCAEVCYKLTFLQPRFNGRKQKTKWKIYFIPLIASLKYNPTYLQNTILKKYTIFNSKRVTASNVHRVTSTHRTPLESHQKTSQAAKFVSCELTLYEIPDWALLNVQRMKIWTRCSSFVTLVLLGRNKILETYSEIIKW